MRKPFPTSTMAGMIAGAMILSVASGAAFANNEIIQASKNPNLWPAPGVEPETVAVSPDGRWVYVTNETSNDVHVIDTSTNRVIAKIKVGANPRGVSFTPDGKRAYVGCERDGTVAVIDTAARRVIATIPVGERPVGTVVSRDGKKVYVAHGRSYDVWVLDTRTHRILTKIPTEQRS